MFTPRIRCRQIQQTRVVLEKLLTLLESVPAELDRFVSRATFANGSTYLGSEIDYVFRGAHLRSNKVADVLRMLLAIS